MVTYAYVIAGSEATGGAGIQVDLKTFHQLGVFGMGTITCVVSVDPKNDWAHRFVPLDAGLIADQIEAATSIRSLDTVKVGMLGTAATIDVVAAGLKRQAWKNVVVDPVLICKGGDLGPAREVDDQLREKILSQATVATPNYFEACTLSGLDRLETVEEMTEAARIISAQGPRYVLVKGGVDFPGPDAVDVLWDGEAATVYSEPKVGHERVSGAGCTLAAAVTAAGQGRRNPRRRPRRQRRRDGVDQGTGTSRNALRLGMAGRYASAWSLTLSWADLLSRSV